MSNCVSRASNGDTVNVSAGSATWSSTLSWNTKGLSIIMAGQGATIITNGLAADNSTPLFQVTNTGNNFVRISGFTLTEIDNQIPFDLIGPIFKIRVDHVTINKGDALHINYIGEAATGPAYGVFDHDQFINMKRPVFATDVRNGDAIWGAAAWAEFQTAPASYPGSGKFMYFEDDQFTWNASNTDANFQSSLYGQYGGKVVFRHNTHNGNCTYVDAHGDGPDYGTIYYEIYNETFNEDNTLCGANDIIGMRGGQLIAHDNAFIGTEPPVDLTVYWPTDLIAHRVQNSYFWNNTWKTSTGGTLDMSQADLVQVVDVPTDPGGSTCSVTGCIRLNVEYFLAAPQSGQTYNPYASYPYPHPLTTGVITSAPAPPTNLSASVR